MSGGKSSYDLCSKMNTTTYTHYHNYSWDRIRGIKPLYKFIYKGGNKFDSSIISTQLFTNNLVLSTDDKKCTNHGSLGKCIQDFVEILKRKKNRCPKCDLKEANLKGANLFSANLSGVKLEGATWTDGKKGKKGSIGKCN